MSANPPREKLRAALARARWLELLRTNPEPSLFEQFWAMGPGDERGRPSPERVQTDFIPGFNQSTTYHGWLPYHVPKTANMLMLVCAGGGGAGGAGFNSSGGTAAGGGSGGGSGATSTLIISALHLPRVLYLLPGGATAINTPGAAGNPSIICDQATTTAPAANTILTALAGQGGNNGSASAGGGTGAGANPATHASCVYSGMGLVAFTGGNPGGAGGAITPTAGTSSTINATNGLPNCGGAGGGATSNGTTTSAGGVCNTNGESIAWQNIVIQGGSAGATGGNGQAGVSLNYPIAGWGGGGGGSLGGAGGAGGWMSGGGGSGAIVGASVNSLVGQGGPGFIVVSWW